jgi:hypothetical protein
VWFLCLLFRGPAAGVGCQCGSTGLGGRLAVLPAEGPAEVGHVGEPPAEGDLGDGPPLAEPKQVGVASGEPAPPDVRADGVAVLLEEQVERASVEDLASAVSSTISTASPSSSPAGCSTAQPPAALQLTIMI